MRSYLGERTQSFRVGDKLSECHAVTCSVPQGSVLGPQKFSAYTEEIITVLDNHEVHHHLYADDTQASESFKVAEVAHACIKQAKLISDISSWCSSRRLQLNAGKTEIAWFGSRHALDKIKTISRDVQVGPDTIKPVSVVRDLGVLLDSELSMRDHVNMVVKTCFFHLRRLRPVRRSLGREITAQLVCSFVFTRLDYCNATLAGLPDTTLVRLQRVQNAAARLIMNLKYDDHVTPALIELHWLPIKSRIIYKLCILMYKVRCGICPEYLSDMVQFIPDMPNRGRLRSSHGLNFELPRLRTKFGERAFSYSGPSSWNSLPRDIQSSDNLDIFKRKLKTHLFKLAYNL